MVIANKGYDSNALIKFIEEGILSRNSLKKELETIERYDMQVHKEHHLVEYFFGKIKHFKHISSRLEKTATAFLNILDNA